MLVGFVATSPFGVDPAWVAVAAAIALAMWGLRTGVTSPRDIVAAAQPGLAIFVFGLGVVVAALGHGTLGAHVGGWLPDTATRFRFPAADRGARDSPRRRLAGFWGALSCCSRWCRRSAPPPCSRRCSAWTSAPA